MSAGRPAAPTHFTASDGTPLVGDVAVPADPSMSAVLCHPHPQYGGNRFDAVIARLHQHLPTERIATFRFDFRAEFDDGEGETLDVAAALGTLRRLVPHVPVAVVGYSFGALMTLRVGDPGLSARVLVAPPLTMAGPVAPPTEPTLVLAPEHDQFTTPDRARAATDGWPARSFTVIDGADHFLRGEADDVARRTATFLLEHRTGPEPA